jgi:membrane-bound metal-dependent hydrolase YbcI (DUF457 family)
MFARHSLDFNNYFFHSFALLFLAVFSHIIFDVRWPERLILNYITPIWPEVQALPRLFNIS